MTPPLPIVAIVGRTNVGKSTLFNRLVATRQALVSTVAGTTRDRNIGVCEWLGQVFTVVDSGGLDIRLGGSKHMSKNLLKKQKEWEEMERNIIKQTQLAVFDATFVLFVIDAQVGIMPEDRTVLNFLRKHNKPFLLVANKVDNEKIRRSAPRLLKLGAGDPILVSSASGVGCGDLLDEVLLKLQGMNTTPQEKAINEIRVSIIGRPNVGKSSLLNSLLGEERVIVNEIPHTTRESHDMLLFYNNTPIRLIDTAGIRRKSKEGEILEKMGVKKTLATLSKSDIVLFVVEIQKNVSFQDNHLGQLLLESNASCIIVANKWDLITDKTPHTQNEYRDFLYGHFPYLHWAPIVFTDAKSGAKTQHIFDMILDVDSYRKMCIPPHSLEEFLNRALRKHRPVRRMGIAYPKIFALEQVATQPPHFQLTVDDSEKLHPSYVSYLKNQLYAEYSFRGAPIKISLKSMRT